MLPSGLQLLLHETHAVPVAAVQVWARVGSADEGPDEAGLAHFHEHMLFKGTEARGVGEVAGEIENAGGRVNAYTSLDVTVYHATLPSDALDTGLDVLLDMVRHSLFDPEEIAREQAVVLEEIRRSEDSPWRVLSNALFAEAFRVHPYRAPILGTPESVSGFDREHVVDFYRRWYAPDNLMVVAAGDFDRARLRDEVAARFADARPAGTRPVRSAEPGQDGLRHVVLRRPFERATLELAWPIPGLGHPDTPYLDLLALILGQGDSSRLVRRVKEIEGLADAIDASAFTPRDPGLFSASVELEPARCPSVVQAVLREVERVRREPVRADELEKARANFLAIEHFERESVGGLARKLGSFQALCDDWRAESSWFQAVRKATPEDLLRVARSYLRPERLTVGAVLPEDDPTTLDRAVLDAAVSAGVEETARALAPPRTSRRVGDVHSFALSGGAWLHVVPRRDVPVVALRGAMLGGQLAETPAKAGLTSFLTSMWLRGTRARSAADFARAVESLACDIDGFAGRNSLGVTMECTSEQVEPALDLVSEILLDPAFAPEEIERERRDTLAAIARREDRLAERAFLLFAEHLFREHPYRLPQLGFEESVSGFSRADLVGQHERLVRAGNLVIGVAGDVDPDTVAQQVASRFAELPRGEFRRPDPRPEPPPGEIRTAELRKDRAQAHLVMGFRGLTVDDPDRYPLEALVQLLSGQSGRLFLELRDRQGLAYSVTAVNVEGVAPGYLALYIGTAPEKIDAALDGMRGELERLLDAPPDAEELAGAARHLAGNFAIDQQRSANRAAHLSLDALYGLGPDADREYAERIRAVTPEDVLRVSRRLIDPNAYTLAMVRP